MRLKLVLLCSLFFSLFTLAHAEVTLKSFDGKQGTINISGGTAHIPVMNEAAKKIMQHNNKINITVAGGGSGVGVKQVGEGLVEIGNTGRPLKEDEIKSYDLVSYPFAIDGVAVSVHPSNGVQNLTTADVQKIFSGEIKNWKEVGGKDAAITLYTREDGSGTREVFVDVLLNKGAISPKAVVVTSNGAMKTSLSKDKNAIGYVGIGNVDKTIKAVNINGVEPSQKNASDGTYKVTRLLYMNTKTTTTELANLFIKYVTTSDDAREIIKEAGYIPLH